MTELSDFLEQRTRDSVSRCPMARLIETVRAEDAVVAEQLEEAVTDLDMSMSTLHAALRQAGYKIARESISLHRNKRCICVEE